MELAVLLRLPASDPQMIAAHLRANDMMIYCSAGGAVSLDPPPAVPAESKIVGLPQQRSAQ